MKATLPGMLISRTLLLRPLRLLRPPQVAVETARTDAGTSLDKHHARTFGLCSVAVLAICLVQSAASLSTRICHDGRTEFGAIDAHSTRVIEMSASLEVRSTSVQFESLTGAPATECLVPRIENEPGY